MDSDAIAGLGAVACGALAAAVVAPAVVISGAGRTLADYYAAGPVGLSAAGFLAVVGAVGFLSARRPHADTATVAGVVAVVAVGAVLSAVAWALSLESAVLFSFPPAYAWLTYHRWVVVAAAAAAAAAAGWLAWVVLFAPARGE